MGSTGEYRILISNDDRLLHDSSNIDSVTGGALNDVIVGNQGMDHLNGEGGNDLFIWSFGGDNDNVNGGDGFDVQEVNASDASESFTFEPFFDGPSYILSTDSVNGLGLLLTSVEGLDIRARGGDDRLIVPDPASLDLTGLIKFWGGKGDDTVNGSATSNPFIVYGDAGSDTLIGGRGVDSLNGGNGKDVLRGSRGADALNGGAGDDLFVYKALNESGTTAGHRDQLTGFASGDGINVHAIDAKAGGANNDFVLDTNNTFSQGEIRQTVTHGNLRLDFNVDTDSQAEMSIVLLNHTTLLSSGDFVL